MNLKVLLPFQIFAAKTGLTRIVAETPGGSFVLLPHRLDCVAALAPGILNYESKADGEVVGACPHGDSVSVSLVGKRAIRSQPTSGASPHSTAVKTA